MSEADEAVVPIGTRVRILHSNDGLPIGTEGVVLGYDVATRNIVGETYPSPYPYRIRWEHLLYKPLGFGPDGWDYERSEFEVVE